MYTIVYLFFFIHIRPITTKIVQVYLTFLSTGMAFHSIHILLHTNNYHIYIYPKFMVVGKVPTGYPYSVAICGYFTCAVLSISFQ